MTGTWAMFLVLGVAACDQAPGRSPGSCKMPAQTAVILERDGAILETWTLRLEDVASDALPADPAFLAYRAAIQRDSADVLRPVADSSMVRTDEHFNNELVFSGAVGSVDRISCLDALLFARQASRISQIDRPTEFLAAVLKRGTAAGTELVVVFWSGLRDVPPEGGLRV